MPIGYIQSGSICFLYSIVNSDLKYYITDNQGPQVSTCPSEWSNVSTASDHVCAIASDNNAYCWGYNQSGQLGNGSTTDSAVPVKVTNTGALSGKTIKYITANTYQESYGYTCAIASDDNAYCWGYSSAAYGLLGNGATSYSTVPVAVSTSGVLSGLTILP